ncbi:MAG: hypothetical protein M3Y08_10965 [Fibrobacterota bacterium]|nr:hypothetical protein [Fibrobacterota bacterium]
MKINYTLHVALASATLFSACLFQSKDENMASARFEFKGSATAALAKSSVGSGLVIGDTTGLRVTLTEALVHIKKIRLGADSDDDTCDSSGLPKDVDSSKSSGKDCLDKSDHSVKSGPFIVNLISGAVTPDIGTISIPAGTYNRVKIHIHHAEGKDTGTTPMGGQTLVAKGTYSMMGGQEMPITLSLRFNEVIHIRSAVGMDLDADKVHTLLMGINLGQWMSNLNFKGCLSTLDASQGGAIILNEDSSFGKCLDAEHVLKDNFRASFKIHKK